MPGVRHGLNKCPPSGLLVLRIIFSKQYNSWYYYWLLPKVYIKLKILSIDGREEHERLVAVG